MGVCTHRGQQHHSGPVAAPLQGCGAGSRAQPSMATVKGTDVNLSLGRCLVRMDAPECFSPAHSSDSFPLGRMSCWWFSSSPPFKDPVEWGVRGAHSALLRQKSTGEMLP